MGRRQTQLSEIQHGRRERAPALRHDDAVRSDEKWSGDVRRSRIAMGYGGPQRRHHRHEVRRVSRRGEFSRRHGLDTRLPADEHVDEGRLPRRGGHRPFRADEPDYRRVRVAHHGRGGHQELAGDDLPDEVHRRLQAHAGAVLRQRQLYALGRGPLQRRLPPLQGGTRANRRFRERPRGPADRRPGLRVPQSRGQARLVPQPFRSHRHDGRFLRRRSQPEIFDPFVGKARPAVERALRRGVAGR